MLSAPSASVTAAATSERVFGGRRRSGAVLSQEANRLQLRLPLFLNGSVVGPDKSRSLMRTRVLAPRSLRVPGYPAAPGAASTPRSLFVLPQQLLSRGNL